MSSDIKRALDKANLQLAMLDGDNSPEALAKKLIINNARADALYALADAAKAAGNDKAYWSLHDAANAAWGAVNEAAHDLEAAPRRQLLADFQAEHPEIFDMMVAKLTDSSSE